MAQRTLRRHSAGIASAPLEIVSSHAGHLWDALCRAYTRLGLDHAAGSDEVFRDLVLARIIEPTSKQDSLRVMCEVGVEPVSYRTVTRRLPVFAKPTFRQSLSAACARLRPTLNPTGSPSWRPVLAAACSRRPPRDTGCRNHEATEFASTASSFTHRRATATDIAWLDEQLVVANPRGLIGLSSQADQHVAENRWTIEDYDIFDVWRHRSAVGQLGGHPGIGPQEPEAVEVDLGRHQVHVGFVVAHNLPNLRPAVGGGLPNELGLRQRVVNFFSRWPLTNLRQGRQWSFHSGFGSRTQDFVVQLIAA